MRALGKEKSMCEVSDWKELGNKESGRLQMKQAWRASEVEGWFVCIILAALWREKNESRSRKIIRKEV